jgi:hypothetical protein
MTEKVSGLSGHIAKSASEPIGYLTCAAFNIVTTEMVQADNDGNRPDAFLSQNQHQILVEKLGGPGERVAAFCKAVGLENLGEVAASEFDKLVARVTRFNQANPAERVLGPRQHREGVFQITDATADR